MRKTHRLPEALKDASAITDREGWVSDTFTLRGLAKRLGYDRGEILDSGGFNTYVKRFATAGYASVLTFSGSGVPEENLTAAPISVSVRRLGSRHELPLSDVPAVLLSEVWNDYHDFAAKGRYDVNWTQTVNDMWRF